MVSDQLTAKGRRPRAVICPSDLETKKGATSMRCSLQANDGTAAGLTVIVISVNGDDVNFDCVVGK